MFVTIKREVDYIAMFSMIFVFYVTEAQKQDGFPNEDCLYFNILIH